LATSGSFNFAATRDDIITEALEYCGELAVGQSPSTNQITSCARTLNMLIKAWQADGLQLFRRKEYQVTLVAGDKDYVFGAGGSVTEVPTRILYAYSRSTDGNDTEITAFSNTEYAQMSNKSTTSTSVNSYYYDYQGSTATLYVWPTPAAGVTDVVRVLGERPIYDFDASSDDADVPNYYFLALSYGLAMALCTKFGVEENQAGRIERLATYYKNEALGYDVEYNTSLQLQPNFQ
jgi:hypothetical protein